MVLAAVHELEQATVLDRLHGVPRALGQVLLVFLQIFEACALDAAGRAVEAQAHHAGRQTDDLKQAAAAIAGDGRDAHLGHDLEQALADGLAIAAAQLGTLGLLELDPTLAHHVEQRLIGHVRIDGRRAIADEAGEVMRITRRTGLDDQVALAAQTQLHQTMVDGTGGQQSLHRNLVAHQIAV